MEFGVFDHLDRSGLGLADFYEGRLKLAELYDRGGFHCLHIAEHHGTPLGLAPSPGMFLAAVAQRTTRLKFGPLVYTLPLYHPLRLVEEICMLDQLSHGRYQIGIGRGISPIETGFYGVASDARQAMFDEVLAVLRQGLTQRRVSFHGKYHRFDYVPIELEPVQRPHPPFWVGVTSAEAAARAANAGSNMVCVATAPEVRGFIAAYRAHAGSRAAARGDNTLSRAAARGDNTGSGADGNDETLLGLARFVIIAESDDEALDLARRLYPRWHRSFYYLFAKHGGGPEQERASDFDQIKDGGRGIAGSPDSVIRMLRQQLSESGANYFVGQFAFGDIAQAQAERSVALFARHVMPELRRTLG
jgi:alkanesulfonate monooxygenase SsuD/methylene tetrahydromethanopterin reductase-like flavin-dependent oxidoreductase (luciferase family)